MREPPQPPAAPSDRRPIAARRLRFFQWLAGALARAGVTPNTISVLGMLCGIGAGVCLFATAHVGDLAWLLWVASAGLVGERLLANMLDGMVAVEGGLATPTGALFNEVPDRVSDAATLVGLGYATGGLPWLGFVAALCAVFVAYVRSLGASVGAPNDFCGPMAKQQRMALVILTALAVAIHPPLADEFHLPRVTLGIIAALCVVTAMRRLRRAAVALRRAAEEGSAS